MSLHEIKDQIAKDAQKKAHLIDDEASAESAKLIASAKEGVKNIEEQSKRELAWRYEAMARESKAGIEIERHNSLLVAKEIVVDSHLNSVKKAIVSQIMKGNYEKFLKKAMANAQQLIGTKDMIIKADKESLKILKKLGYHAEASGEKGIKMQSKDGAIRVDGSIDSMIESHIELIKSKINEAVFEEKKSKVARVVKAKPKKAKTVKKKVAKKSKRNKK
ncbi:MAG: V-type ATP synthase subunit E [Candidatus Micrarchaeales archaeon]